MKMQTNLSFFLFSFLLLFIAMYLNYNTFENEKLSVIIQESYKEKLISNEKIMSLKNARLKAFVLDYACLDSMINFIRAPETGWAQQNIESALTTFDANAAWIYGSDLSLVYSTNNFKKEAGFKELPIPKEAFQKLFKEKRTRTFFIEVDDGFLLVYGSTVYPGTDHEMQTPPQGYFLAGRLWDKAYIEDLSGLLAGNILITQNARKAKLLSLPELKNAVTIFTQPLRGWDGKPLGFINYRVRFPLISNYFRLSKNTVVAFVIYMVSLLFILLVFIYYYIGIPIRMISQALNKENPRYINALKNKKDEFGDVARMIASFFAQKVELESENAERREMVDMLDVAQRKYHSFFESSRDGYAMVDMRGFIIETNSAYKQMLGFTDAELFLKTYSDITPEKWRIFEKKIFDEQVYVRGFSDVYEKEYIRKDGVVFPVSLRTYLLKDRDGKPAGMWAFVRDISESKKMEEKLKEKVRDLEDFHKFAVGREMKLIELKQKIQELEKENQEYRRS
ncbi:MAG: PAS domain S-box protein [Candidatus Omnitrophota bacterium]|jgi:PAS domain S-box-containing protein